MNLMSPLRNLSIHQRVLLLALVPTLTVTLLLFAFATLTRLEDARQTLLEETQLQLDYLSVSAELGLITGNRDALRQISRPALDNDSVEWVSFLDAQGQLIAGPQAPPTDLSFARDAGVLAMDSGWYAYRAIRPATLPVDDFFASRQPPERLGWVLIKVSNHQLLQRERTILLAGLALSLGGLVLAVWLALMIGRTISRPVQAISRMVARLREDQLDARAKINDRGELGELQQGVNDLAERIQYNRQHLEREVTRATGELQITLEALEAQNTKLERARQRAERANRTKDEFLARMSHELRTPLTSVLGFVGLLSKTGLDAQQQEYSRIVYRTSSLLLNLIDDLLDFSKLESGAIRLESLPFSLEECVEDMLHMHSAAARNKGLDLKIQLDPALPDKLLGDPTRIRQILTNLVSNAIKFTSSGQVSIDVQCHQASPDQCHVRVCIADSGIGISAAQQRQLFKPFAQADSSISRRFGGSGLGLVISRQLSEMMGGGLKLESTLGNGTRVTLELPLEVVTPAPGPQCLAGRRLVLYARQTRYRYTLERRLNYWGCATRVARSRRQLMGILASGECRQCCGLILCLSRRELDRLRQASWPHELRRDLDCPLILLTSLDAAEVRREYAEVLARLEPLQVLGGPAGGQALVAALRHPPAPAASVEPPAPAPPRQYQGHLRGWHILLAEDNAFNQLLIQRILEFEQAEVTCADNGAQALEALKARLPDLVLMDLHMPVMNGIQACAAIRALPGAQGQVPIIALSASVAEGDREALKPYAVNAFINKPVSERALIDAVRQACQPEEQPNTNPLPLKRYGITPAQLQEEIAHQVQALETAHAAGDTVQMRDHSHQLMGLAGLLHLSELDAVAQKFNLAVKTEQGEAIETALKMLKEQLQKMQESTG